MRVVFVHGACVRDGRWWWHRAAEVLSAGGIASITPALPSCGEDGVPPDAQGPGLDDDVAAVRTVLADSSEATILVAHSYGGIVAAQAAVGIDTVRHAVLISSYLAEPGESLSSFGSDEPAPFLAIDPDAGTFTVRPELLTDTFLQDCPSDVVAEAQQHLAAQSLSVIAAPVTQSAWPQVPTTYLVCTQDRGTPADAQREFARRANHVIEIETGHHPFLSRPDAVAQVITTLA